eukprot:gene25248-31681_t
MIHGQTGWRNVQAKKTGEVDVHFSVSWNELVQALSSTAVYEFQGWARATTYVRTVGSYIINCQGVHSVFVRNDNMTHVLVGDVYRSGQVLSNVDLRVGLVGFAVPLRGAGQTSFNCQISPATETSLVVHAPRHVPDLLELSDEQSGKGLLLSNVFALPVQNVQTRSITVEYSIEKPLGEEGEFFVRPVSSKEGAAMGGDSTAYISPGQTVVVALEVVAAKDSTKGVFLNCQKNRGAFRLVVTPSRGRQVHTQLDFACRRQNQSVSVSFVDHDGSVAQVAVIMPLSFERGARNRMPGGRSSVSANKGKKWPKADSDLETSSKEVGTCGANMNCADVTPNDFPVLLTLHGSGISASSHADAYKVMPKGGRDYVFGVLGYWVVAPSRFGAHNWEGVGELSAKHSVTAVQSVFRRAPAHLMLPQLRLEGGVLAGHSMGGHGAWVAAVNSPELYTCLLPGSGWVRKEEYNTANAFFALDASNSLVDNDLKAVLELAMSEFHVDRLAVNLQGMDVHVRVGSADLTTHPWFSRRMHRLLVQNGVNSTLEEVHGKAHWWWDTLKDNDGGVVNDPVLREVYARCLDRTNEQHRVRQSFLKFLSSREVQNSGSLSGTDTKLYDDWLQFVLQQASGGNETTQSISESRTCHRNVSLVVLNPAAHSGMCGLRVHHQHRTLSRSTVKATCVQTTPTVDTDDHSLDGEQLVKRCVISTHNVHKLRLGVGFNSVLFGATEVLVDGLLLDMRRARMQDVGEKTLSFGESTTVYSGGQQFDRVENDQFQPSEHYLEVCWTASGVTPELCEAESATTPLAEKSLVNYGPIRQVFSRPFYIVYGTPQNQALRLAMKDLAVYLGNAHYAAHGTSVRVLSDLEYRTGNYAKSSQMNNIVFVGGPNSNKLLKMVCANSSVSRTGPGAVPVLGRLPDDLRFSGGAEENDYSFGLHSRVFDQADQGIIFTLPLHRPMSVGASNTPAAGKKAPGNSKQTSTPIAFGATGMAVCIHANSALGYLHLSRLAWPVVPPMVRAPFATNLPDFIVIDHRVWAQGFGAVLAAGFWAHDWKVDEKQSFFSH